MFFSCGQRGRRNCDREIILRCITLWFGSEAGPPLPQFGCEDLQPLKPKRPNVLELEQSKLQREMGEVYCEPFAALNPFVDLCIPAFVAIWRRTSCKLLLLTVRVLLSSRKPWQEPRCCNCRSLSMGPIGVPETGAAQSSLQPLAQNGFQGLLVILTVGQGWGYDLERAPGLPLELCKTNFESLSNT